MTSYHRVLKLFDRAVTDHSLQCNCDLHPWQITINGERWTGKIRLIGFIDVLFLISYSGQSTFRRGVVIYKDENDIKDILGRAGKDVAKFQQLDDNGENNDSSEPTVHIDTASGEPQMKYFKFWRDSMDYKLRSIGFEIGLQTSFNSEAVVQYEIFVRKPEGAIFKRQVKKAFKQHDSLDLIEDAILIGYISYADLLGAGLGQIVGAGPAGTILKNFNSSMQSAQSGGTGGLSGGNM